MNRIAISSICSVSGMSTPALRVMSCVEGRVPSVFKRLFATTENQVDSQPTKEGNPELEEIMKTAGDFSIPIEQLVTPVERYRRITILSRKPYQLGKNMINRYFKTYCIERDF